MVFSELVSVEHWVTTYGYAGIFILLVLGIVGLPVPDEWLLVFVGYFVYKGRLHPVGAFLAALGGSTCGITCSFVLGRKLGLPFLHSRFGKWLHISDRQIARVHDWYRRIGHWALFVGYFIPGVRHFSALVAGTSLLEWRNFALYAYTGALFWVSTFLFIGYHFGDRWQTVIGIVEANLKRVSIVAGGVILCYVAWRYATKKRKP